jgi:integrase
MSLTFLEVRNAKSKDKPYKLSDGEGLYLLINPSGSKLWRFKYRFDGKEKLLSIGIYPDLSLAEARDHRDQARNQLANNFDPSEIKRINRQQRDVVTSNSVEAVAQDWFERHLSKKAETTKTKVISRMERFVLPYIGKRPVSEVTAPDILEVVRRVETIGSLDTAHRVLQEIGQIFRYAIQTARAESDPTPALRGALPPITQNNFASPAEDPVKVGELLRTLEGFKGSPVVAAAIKILPMVFCRPGELRMMKWADINFETAEWRYTASKKQTPHLVPLTKQVLVVLRDLYPLTGHLQGGYVFVGGRSSMRPMSDAAINAAYRRLGIDTRTELTGHGWRSVARTILHEKLGYDPDVIERQLAHKVKTANGTAYDRTQFLAERKPMMQAWSDYLDKLKSEK